MDFGTKTIVDALVDAMGESVTFTRDNSTVLKPTAGKITFETKAVFNWNKSTFRDGRSTSTQVMIVKNQEDFVAREGDAVVLDDGRTFRISSVKIMGIGSVPSGYELEFTS